MLKNWNDAVFFLGSMVLVLALIPSLFGEAKPELSTSMMTGSVLTTFAINYFTMRFWWSGVITSIAAICWFLLAAQVL